MYGIGEKERDRWLKIYAILTKEKQDKIIYYQSFKKNFWEQSLA